MTTIRLPYVQEFTDRHGRLRRYFRRPGMKRIPLPGAAGSPEFMAVYQAALGDAPAAIGATRTKPGTVNDLCVRFYAAAFPSLAPTTRATYRNVIENFRIEHGDKPVAAMKREHVRAIVNALAAKPGAANKMLRTIKMLMRFAIDENIRADDPTFGVKKIRLASSDGFHSWSEDEVAAYEARHPVGTKARLALDLLLYTAQRRADVARMGPQHVERIDGEDMIRVKQQKTGVELLLPILPPLATSLAATPTGHLVFLTTTSGKPFTPAGFGNWFRDRCREAGLRDCPAHGLRKAATKRLADAGCTDEEMMAWTGHGTRAMLTRYSKGANQKRLAKAGAAKLARSESEQVAVKPGATIVKP